MTDVVKNKAGGGRNQARPPLALSITRESWRLHTPDYWTRPEVQKIYATVVRRDDYTCQFCGFRSAPSDGTVALTDDPNAQQRAVGYMEIHPRNDDHAALGVNDNLTCCPFCHATRHAGVAGRKTEGYIIHFPWLSQNDLNLMLNALAVACTPQTGMHHTARYIFRALESYKAPVTRVLGQMASDPEIFAGGLLSLREQAPATYKALDVSEMGLRYLPEFAQFNVAVDWFKRHAFPVTDEWTQILNRWVKAFETHGTKSNVENEG